MGKLRSFTVLCILLGASVSSASAVNINIYTGYSAGAVNLAGAATAVTAAGFFDAAAGATSLVDFEAAALPVGFTMSGYNRTNVAGCAPNLCGFNTTSGGSFFHQQNGGSQTITFATPTDAFGAYFSGWQIGTQTLTVNYADNSTVVVINMGNADIDQGGIRFLGFVEKDPVLISSVTWNAQNDIVALDDVRYRGKQTTPEPSSLLLLGLSLVGIGLLRSRRNS